MPIQHSHRSAVLLALAASAALTILIIVGSRNLEHYDAALFGYTVASVVAFGAVVFRYAIWLQRPATRVYWKRGWKLFRDRKNLIAKHSSAAETLVGGLAVQKFTFRRGVSHWLMHQLIMWGYGHFQHVRHDPPLITRSWVLNGKRSRLAHWFRNDCKRCDEEFAQEY